MSTAEILSLISTISYVVAAICLFLAVLFWFRFKIPSVIGDLSGRTAKKSIARMRAKNEKAGGQGYKTSATNKNRGKLTDTMHHSRKLDEGRKKPAQEKKPVIPADESLMPETGLLATNKAMAVGSQHTELLDRQDATGLLTDDNATEPLHDEPKAVVKRTGGKQLTMLDEVVLIHTDEVIG